MSSSRIKHGHARLGNRTPEYRSWESMLRRCYNPTTKDYKNYGGRGISVCSRWVSFENFLEDMGSKPSPVHMLERVNNNLGYSPSNCKWAVRKEQNRNKRSTTLNTEAAKVIRHFTTKHRGYGIVLARLYKVTGAMISYVHLEKSWNE